MNEKKNRVIENRIDLLNLYLKKEVFSKRVTSGL